MTYDPHRQIEGDEKSARRGLRAIVENMYWRPRGFSQTLRSNCQRERGACQQPAYTLVAHGHDPARREILEVERHRVASAQPLSGMSRATRGFARAGRQRVSSNSPAGRGPASRRRAGMASSPRRRRRIEQQVVEGQHPFGGAPGGGILQHGQHQPGSLPVRGKRARSIASVMKAAANTLPGRADGRHSSVQRRARALVGRRIGG